MAAPAQRTHSWVKSPGPPDQRIRGLGLVTMSVSDLRLSEAFIMNAMAMRRGRLYEADEAGPAAELHVRAEPLLAPHRQGAGGVHHVAFRMGDDAYGSWVDRFNRMGLRCSGPVDRYYFRSLYVREPGGILFEIATDGPGFDADEPRERLGERLALPTFLEPRRDAIEAGLKPI